MRKGVLGSVLMLLTGSVVTEAAPIRKHPKPVLGSYIVVLNPELVRGPDDESLTLPSVEEVAEEMLAVHGKGRLKHLYRHALRGFAVRLREEEAAILADDFRVEFVEEDGEVRINASQSGATWGLDRIDQRNLPLNSTYNYNQTGAAVHAYVLDTGIRATHTQFVGRIGNGFTAIADANGTADCHGHGTHVAGTIGGTTYGVAKNVTLHAVRVLGCTGGGTIAGAVAGVDWVTQNHVKPAVANMSLESGGSTALDQAVANSVAAGVTYAVAAGNSSADACSYSPARAGSALTVGATTSADAQASYSNFGTCLDLYAPGSSVTSAYYTSDTAIATMSGTSMATPHVAGAAALYLETNPTATPAAVAQGILSLATQNVVSGAGAGSPNRLLHSLFQGGNPADTTPPQTWITSPAGGATVSGTIAIQAQATDASGVGGVEFYVDGALKCTDITPAYSCSWDSRSVVNGTHSLRTVAYDTWNNLGQSATVSITVNNPIAPSELVVNGGFENGSSPWALAGAASRTAGTSAHSGSGYALLGSANKATGTLAQSVSIPTTAPASLTFWLSVGSNDRSATATDRLYVEVVSSAGTTTLGSFSNLDRGTAGVYTMKTFGLSAYRGQTVTLRFRATTDNKWPTTFYVDDVSLR